MSDHQDQRIHPASPIKLQSLNREGERAKSQALAAAIQLLGAMLVALICLPSVAVWIKELTADTWTRPLLIELAQSETGWHSPIQGLMQKIASQLAVVLLPVGLAMLGWGVLAHWIQSGPVFLPTKMRPQWSRLFPTSWVQRTFAWKHVGGHWLSFPQLMMAVVSMAISCWYFQVDFWRLGNLPADEMTDALFRLVLKVGSLVAGTLIVVSSVDYWIKYHVFQQEIQMTDEELREEARTQQAARWNR